MANSPLPPSPCKLLTLVALGWMVAYAGAAVAHVLPGAGPAAAVDGVEDAPAGRAAPAAFRFLPPSLQTRVTFASGGSQRSVAPGNSSSPAPRQPQRGTGGARAVKPVIAVSGTSAGQSGYVHYFVIETPDGERETQIGIELDDGRIAWSFPELGVILSPFIKSGQLAVNGRHYGVQHQYGLRPFANGGSMAALRRDLWSRVIPWIEDETPYCNLMTRSNQLCLSCLGFVMRVLYPARSGTFLSLPADFPGGSAGPYITTEDLLLYQTGLHGLGSRQARLKRIARLDLPRLLREDLIELVTSIDAEEKAAARSAKAPRAKSRSRVQRGTSRPVN